MKLIPFICCVCLFVCFETPQSLLFMSSNVVLVLMRWLFFFLDRALVDVLLLSTRLFRQNRAHTCYWLFFSLPFAPKNRVASNKKRENKSNFRSKNCVMAMDNFRYRSTRHLFPPEKAKKTSQNKSVVFCCGVGRGGGKNTNDICFLAKRLFFVDFVKTATELF
jgi:hypothetical protein